MGGGKTDREGEEKVIIRWRQGRIKYVAGGKVECLGERKQDGWRGKRGLWKDEERGEGKGVDIAVGGYIEGCEGWRECCGGSAVIIY